MNDMNMGNANPGPWWRQPWPWFLMALPAAAVVGGIVTLWLAARNADSLVSDDYYKEGMAIRQVLERDAKAKALNLVAELSAPDSRMQIVLSGQLSPPPTLTLHLIHPTRAEQDVTLTLQADADGRYATTLPTLPAGIRQLVLEPTDRSWRLTGEWRSPFTGQLSLRP